MIKRIKSREAKMKRTKIIIVLLFAFILTSQVFTQPVLARSSGSGKMNEFKTEKFLTSVGIGMASSFVGGAIADGIGASATGGDFFAGGGRNAFTGKEFAGFSSQISNIGNIGTWTSSYNSVAAMNQLSSGTNMLGQQQEWDNSDVVFTTSVVSGAVSGGVLNPTPTISTLATGVTSGIAEGAILANNIDGNGKIKPWVSSAASVTGAFVGGVTSSLMEPVVPGEIKTIETSRDDYVQDPASKKWKYSGSEEALIKLDSSRAHVVSAPVPGDPNTIKTVITYSPHTADNLGGALTHGGVSAFSALPSRAINMGVTNITKHQDRNDAFMTRQAFRGVYPIAAAGYKPVIRDPILIDIGLEHYTDSNGTTGGDVVHMDDRSLNQVPPATFDSGANLIDK